MAPDVPIFVLALAGLGVGFIVGLTGMGGGAIMTPVLVLLFKVDPTTAVGSDLVVSLLMKPVGGGVHLRKGTVNLRLVGWLVAGSVPAAFFGVWAFSAVFGDDMNDAIKLAIGCALLVASGGLIAKGAFSTKLRADADVDSVQIRPLPTFLIGVFGGLAVGITSVGSGSLMMPLILITYPMLSAKRLVGTDLVQAVPLVASAALAHMVFGEVSFALTGALVLGALPGVWAGAHISSRAPDYVIRPILAVVLIISGLKMLGLGTIPTGLAGLVMAVGAAGLILRSRGVHAADAAAQLARDTAVGFGVDAAPLGSDDVANPG